MSRYTCLLGAALAWSCGDNRAAPDARVDPDAAIDAPADAAPDANPLTPQRLVDTGLCVDAACTQLAAGVRTYEPRWTLWTDGAAKDRWIWLPPGTKINNGDADHWQFPVGTKLWKSFSLGGVRVETRYLLRLGPAERDWFMMSYAWNATQSDAVAVPEGRVDANGTTHDIPSSTDCRDCHDRIHGNVLGFSALALDYDAPADRLDLEDLAALDWLTTPLPGAASPRYPLPTGRTPEEDAAAADAVGYLHINCGHCHNPQSPVYAGSPLELRLTTGGLTSWPATTTYTTAVDVTTSVIVDGTTVIVKPQDADNSVLIKRMLHPDPIYHMPALGSVIVDEAAQTKLRAWIDALPVN
ncbi:MAG: hypothetical protein R3B48_08070 [Kofleriaceae bacterium]